MAYKQQNFISHSLETGSLGAVCQQGPVLGEPISKFANCHIAWHPHMKYSREEALSLATFIGALIWLMRPPP